MRMLSTLEKNTLLSVSLMGKQQLSKLLVLTMSIVALSACSGGVGSDSGAAQDDTVTVGVDNTPDDDNSTNTLYTGPTPTSDDIQRFKNNFWENLRSSNRCGNCHSNNQEPYFVYDQNVNTAYDNAISLINRDDPASSSIVSKVADGHNCWLGTDQECADAITGYISSWVNVETSVANTITLRAPDLNEPGSSKNFPASAPAEYAGVHTLLNTYCIGCHVDTSDTPVTPYFANADIDISYQAAQSKINLEVPTSSRLVERLASENHNCWTTCSSNASDMLDAINALVNAIPTEEVDGDILISRALTLDDGLVVSSGGRHETNVIARYEFKAGEGDTIFDSSDFGEQMNLQIQGQSGIDYEWIGGWGVRFNTSRGFARAPSTATSKLYDNIATIGEYAIEAWVTPGNVGQEDAVIAGYMFTPDNQNFALKQNLYDYEFTQRSTETDESGAPEISTLDADEILQSTLQHVVMSFDPVNGRQLYVNGEVAPLDSADETIGNLTNWADGQFILANDPNGTSPFEGVIRLVAVHNRAMNAEQITQNYDAGVGERFFLLFSISHLINVEESYIVFEVSQFDSYSYLFNAPFYVSLDADANPQDIPLVGMRIGINGREVEVGQAYRNLNVMLDADEFNEEGRQYLSELGTLIAIEKGTSADEFFLSFEQIGTNTTAKDYAAAEAPSGPPSVDTTEDPQVDIGVRTFDEINVTMSELTGIAKTQSDVNATFLTIKQSLPTIELLNGFASANQMAITQLAIKYCSVLVDDTSARENFFGTPSASVPNIAAETLNGSGFNANDITDTQWEDWIIDPLINRMVGVNLTSQPDLAAIRAEVLYLVATTEDNKPVDVTQDVSSDGDGQPDGLAKCGGNCPTGHTSIVTKAACAAVLGSATMLIQ